MITGSGGGPAVRAAFLMEFVQQTLEIVRALVVRGSRERLAQRGGDAKLVVREFDANQIAVAIGLALVRAGRGKGVFKTHTKVTIGKPMGFAVLRNPLVTVS